MNKRDTQLDILKGIGILLVVFAHTCRGAVKDYVYLFHMPLFFFLSGAALNYSRSKDLNLKKRLKCIMLPYLVFSMICFLYWSLIEVRFRPVHDTDLFPGWLGTIDYKWQQLSNLFLAFSLKDAFHYNITMWFLPCLFSTIVIHLTLKKWLSHYSWIGITAVVSIAFIFKDLRLPWCIEIAFVALPFMFGGEMFYGKIREQKSILGGVFLVPIIILVIIYAPHVRMGSHQYGDWRLFYLLAFLPISTLVIFSRYFIDKNYGVLEWLGRNSLAIMCIHEPIKRILLVLLSKLVEMDVNTLRDSTIICIGVTMLLVTMLVPIVFAINKWMPSVLGK